MEGYEFMFFSKKNNTNQINELETQVAALKEELEFYKEMSTFSQEEMLVVLDGSGSLIFQNEKASMNIKSQSELIRELQKIANPLR